MANKAWGDIDEEETPMGQLKLPAPETITKGSTKKVISYVVEEGKVLRKTRTYRIETLKTTVPQHVLERRKWAKFGKSAAHSKGPDPSTTTIGEDVYLVLKSKQELTAVEDTSDQDMRKQLAGKQVKCRYCKGDHWSTKCPHKDKLSVMSNMQDNLPPAEDDDGADDGGRPGPLGKGRYVPPSQRAGRGERDSRGDSMNARDDSATVRITNLPENTRDDDLKELCKPFGPIQRCYLATDKATGLARGFAFVSFYRQEHAAKCIESLNGYGYDHLILKAEWAKPNPEK